MKSKIHLIAIIYLFFATSTGLSAVGEKTITMNGSSIWKMSDYRAGITEMKRVRTDPVLVLSSERGSAPVYGLDLALSFDEGSPQNLKDNAGHYQVNVSPDIALVDDHYARVGFGAVLFNGSDPGAGRPEKTRVNAPLMIEANNRDALFAADNHIYDFSIEFWLQPFNMENGEQILLWTSARPMSGARYIAQRIMCISSKNRLQWSFSNFFALPDGTGEIDLAIGGTSPVVPKTWSHHLIRFDSMTGMLEYLMNGKTEAIEYATSTGHEGGEVYTPIAGEGGFFILGGSFAGMMDEFRIHGGHAHPALRKYPLNGGRIETRAFDLGDGNNDIIMLEASGGRVSVSKKQINNEFKRNGRFRFSDDSEMQFFIRGSDNPYRWENSWRPVIPGAELSGTILGRYLQVAVDFYPSANGETSPYLEELRITYIPDEAPLAPTQLTAVAIDGAVQLRWKHSPNQNTRGYLVYYGTSSDDYFGEGSVLGASPIDVGRQNTITINGLKNGTLYYFRVAAYSQASQVGEFSREVRARPLR